MFIKYNGFSLFNFLYRIGVLFVHQSVLDLLAYPVVCINAAVERMRRKNENDVVAMLFKLIDLYSK